MWSDQDEAESWAVVCGLLQAFFWFYEVISGFTDLRWFHQIKYLSSINPFHKTPLMIMDSFTKYFLTYYATMLLH